MTAVKRLLALYNSQRVRGIMRVLGFFVLLNAIVTALWLRSAQAEVEMKARRAGLELLRQLGPLAREAPEELNINGMRMFFSARSTDLAPKEVLDRFEVVCRESSERFKNEVGSLPSKALAVLPERLHDPANWLSHRKDVSDEAAGQVACFAPRGTVGGIKGLIERMNTALTTGDLNHVGDVRYVIARPEQNGKTLVLALWSDGSFNVPAMFPENADAPGNDPTHAPRPPESRRILSAQIADSGMAFRSYESNASHEEVHATYARAMNGRTWSKHVVPAPRGSFDINEYVSAFTKNNAVFIVVTNDTSHEKIAVTLIEMANPGVVRGLQTSKD